MRDVPANPVRVNVDDVEWEIKVMGAETYQVPLNVYHIILAAEEHNVPFGYYLWGEEQFQRPMFVPSRWLVRFRISTIEAGDIAQMQRLWPPCSGFILHGRWSPQAAPTAPKPQTDQPALEKRLDQ